MVVGYDGSYQSGTNKGIYSPKISNIPSLLRLDTV
jgi:hypothetical protein